MPGNSVILFRMSKFYALLLVLISVQLALGSDSPTSTIKGRIVDEAEHAPIGNVYILFRGAGGGDATTHTASDGSYSVSVKPGVYDVFASNEPFLPTCHALKVEAGQTVSLDMIMKVNGGVLEEIGILKVPPVVFRGDCGSNQIGYDEWFRGTQLPDGKPYLVSEERRQQIVGHYSKLKLTMSLQDVEKLLGNPDFAISWPPARLITQPRSQRGCKKEVAYILKKMNENMADTADVAIYLFFSPEDLLYWAAPQNLPDQRSLGSPDQ